MANKPQSTSDGPKQMTYEFLRKITDDFGHVLGSGGFGTVYKGVLQDEQEIAVKVFQMPRVLDEKQFQKELKNLWRLNHQNIVKLVGFCNESVLSTAHTALCLEYLHGGSLEKHISDEKTGLNWRTRYKIIRGVCEGLRYLHEGLDVPILHLDLKPHNVLLDKNMIPKIADFGLARHFGEENKTGISSMDTRGYCPPEYMNKNIISEGFDIFSLGIIIVKIMTGNKGYDLIADMRTEQFVDYVHDNWRRKLSEILSPRSLEAYCKQVRRCIEIGLECIKWNRLDRPTIRQIVSTLTETEIVILDLGLQIQQFREEELIPPKKNIQKRPSLAERQMEEIVEDVSTSETKESKPSILSTLPKELPLDFLKEITDNFSVERIIGEDSFGTDYEGILQDKDVIVVKRLKETSVPRVKIFTNEIENTKDLQHQNIVRLIGYCQEGHKKLVQKNGTYVFADIDEFLLCYEYLPMGSVHKNMLDKSSMSDWDIRFKVIKGICQGLLYLHTMHIIHMDLKPENVLLDNNMVAKIADFGMSRIIDKEQTWTTTDNVMGSIGYIAPEYFFEGEISTQTDIYSVGLTIIEIVTREENTIDSSDPSARSFIEKVREKWTYDHIVSVHPYVEAIRLQQIKECIEIGLECVEIDWKKRPSMETIVNRISDTFQC